jgi:predicted RNase H-like nuclease (RuvC/YqgF family)
VIQPKRYSLVASYYCSDAKMEAFEDGEFVRHADYAALQAENERLRKYWKATGEGVNRYVGKSIELEDKVAALHAENEGLQNELHDAFEDIEREMRKVRDLNEAGLKLQAENERLRKAGDAMHLAHEANFNGYPYTQNQVEKAMKAWLAAKGVQP